MELPWQEPCSRCTDEPMPLVAICDAPPTDSDEESVVADVEDPFADVIYGEALDPSEPSSVDEVHRISQFSGVVHHLAETAANVVGRQSCKRRRLLTKRSSEEGSASVSVQFVLRAPGDPVYKDTTKTAETGRHFQGAAPTCTSGSCVRGHHDANDITKICNTSNHRRCWKWVGGSLTVQIREAGRALVQKPNKVGRKPDSTVPFLVSLNCGSYCYRRLPRKTSLTCLQMMTNHGLICLWIASVPLADF